MRTVAPEAWHRSRKPPLNKTTMRFGRPQEAAYRASFRDAMKEYWRHCSVSGVRYITDPNKHVCVRYSYTFFLLLLICIGLLAMALNTYQKTTDELSTVDQREGLNTVYDVPFPAVGLCSNIVIGRRALLEYTSTLAGARYVRNSNYSVTEMMENLSQLSHLLSMTLPQQLVDLNFMDYLATVDPLVRVSGLMLKFAANCSTMLVRCSWGGKVLPCQDLFQTRVTPLGFCCVFNSRYQAEDVYKLPKFLNFVGEDYGLSVVLKQDMDDVISLRRPSKDINVLIFDGSDYPLLEGGGARLYPAVENASVYLSLTASMHYPEEGLDHDMETLRCNSRRTTGPYSSWSYAWCLADCRQHTLAKFCACRLHTLPPLPRDNNHTAECSLEHLPCINKHREKLLYYYPGISNVPLEQVIRNAQNCSHCVPDCARVVYSASVAVSRYSQGELFKDQLLDDLPPDNLTTIRLYYSSKHLKSYVFQSNSRWYEMLVHSGSEWVLIVGASVVSVSEIVFFFSLRWWHHYQRRTANP